MRFFTGFLLVVLPALAHAGDLDGPLRYMPRQADAAIVVDSPRRLVDALVGFEPLRQLAEFSAVREQLESTKNRQFLQLVSYYEKALGHPWPELLDRLAGGGVAVGVRFGDDPAPSLLVVKAKDEVLLHRAAAMIIEVINSEIERTEAPFKLTEESYRGVTCYHLGKDAFAAVAGPALFVSNKAECVRLAIDLYINGAHESMARDEKVEAARALLPAHPLAWIYASLAKAHESSEGQASYRYPKGDPGQLVLFQGLIDVVGKSPSVAAGLYGTGDGFRTTIRMAGGRDATPPGLGLHLPPAGQPGSLPLLDPRAAFFSTSFYFDLGRIWTEREKLLTADIRKGLEESDKNLGRFLAGRKLGDLLTSVGPYHRLVFVAQAKAGYKTQPEQMQPAGAFVSDLRNAGYAESMAAVLRATAFLVGAQYKMKLTEEKIGDATLVAYRFPEDQKVEGDPGNNRFNASPCFAKVGNQFMVASTVELGRELVAKLQEPATSDPARGSGKTTRMRADSAGAAALLGVFEDQLLTQTVLGRAVSVEQARKEAGAFVRWVRGIGRLEFDVDYGPGDFRYDITLKRAKPEQKP